MIKSSLIATAAAAVLGVGLMAAGTAPAAADEAYFGLHVGRGGDPGVSFGYATGYPRYPDYPRYQRHRRYAPVDEYRPVYREARPVEVCRDVWRTRRLRNEWGEVVKVVKVRDEECRVVYR